jgi:hypothetical protein
LETCVYTFVLGGYDELLEQTVALESSSDFICFTDDPELISNTWRTVLVEPRFPQDLVRSARLMKILGHESLDAYDATLCIDASVQLRRPPELLIADWLAGGEDMALPLHSYRDEVIDEFDEVVRLNYDEKARVHEQLIDYSIACPEVLSSRAHWTGMIARRRSERVSRAMRLWADHVLRYSRRDQLSVMTALSGSDITYRSVGIDNFDSPDHSWPNIARRRIAQGKASPLPAGPLLAELRRARRLVAEYERTVDLDALARHEMTIVHLHDQIDQGTAQRTNLEARIDALLRDLGARDDLLRRLGGVREAAANLRRAITRRVTTGR